MASSLPKESIVLPESATMASVSRRQHVDLQHPLVSPVSLADSIIDPALSVSLSPSTATNDIPSALDANVSVKATPQSDCDSFDVQIGSVDHEVAVAMRVRGGNDGNRFDSDKVPNKPGNLNLDVEREEFSGMYSSRKWFCHH